MRQLLLVLAIAAPLVGCRDKRAQCKDFIGEANSGLRVVDELDRRATEAQAACKTVPTLATESARCDAEDRRAKFLAYHDSADGIEREVAKVRAVPVKDADLARLATAYVGKQLEVASISRDLAALHDEKRKEPLTLDDLRPLVVREAKLASEVHTIVDDINRTCDARPQ